SPWRKKPQYVEWDLTGSATSGLGAVIYPSSAPMVVIHELEPSHRTYEDVAAAVVMWVSTVSDQYRLNEEFERFKALAHKMEGEAPPEEGLGYPKPPRR
ncbi:MAG: hypothetical protein U9N78_08490, partial [Actinomycetota bacterium]|nr:hypothetical protein [Actinomycetota bacterium]